MNTRPSALASCPGEWIRIFAVHLAVRRPDLSATEVVSRSIREFDRSRTEPPEEAAARLDD